MSESKDPICFCSLIVQADVQFKIPAMQEQEERNTKHQPVYFTTLANPSSWIIVCAHKVILTNSLLGFLLGGDGAQPTLSLRLRQRCRVHTSES